MFYSEKFASDIAYRDEVTTPVKLLSASSLLINTRYQKCSETKVIIPQVFKTCEGDRPLAVQFAANDANVLLAAARHVEHRCDAVVNICN
jgi:hypothetical protein